MRATFLRLSALSLCLAASAAAQITPVGPFTGDQSEGFEATGAQGFVACLPNRVFNNSGDLCGANGGSNLLVSSGWGFRCSISPNSGARFFGSAGDPAKYTFDQDITSFGGYFGTNSWEAGNPTNAFVSVEFYARGGAPIGTVTANVTPDCQWTWNGWTSTVGVAEIIVRNSIFGGAFVDMDDMEIRFGSTTLGTTYCTSTNNSTGQASVLAATGSLQVSANNVNLRASQMPNNSFGFFLASRTAGNVGQPGGSQGILCLGGQIGRFVGPGLIQNSGNTGAISLGINLNALPQPTGSVPAVAGETWRFQAWFRDSNPTVTSNFSSGLELTFQ